MPGKQILVVDDEAAVTLALEGFFRDRGYRVRRAFYADQALAQIEEERPALVILDLNMPGVDGISVLKKIRESYPEVKTLVVTAFPSRYQEKLELLKPQSVKIKPISLEDLTHTVETLLGETRTGHSFSPEASPGGIRPLFIEGKQELYLQHLKTHFEAPGRRPPCEITLARGPEEALELLKSFKPHFVLLDNTRLPIGVDGGKFASDLNHASHPPLEVILYTMPWSEFQGATAPEAQLQQLEEAIRQAAKRHHLLPETHGG